MVVNLQKQKHFAFFYSNFSHFHSFMNLIFIISVFSTLNNSCVEPFTLFYCFTLLLTHFKFYLIKPIINNNERSLELLCFKLFALFSFNFNLFHSSLNSVFTFWIIFMNYICVKPFTYWFCYFLTYFGFYLMKHNINNNERTILTLLLTFCFILF